MGVLLTLVIKLHDDSTITVSDTATSNAATAALMQFKDFKTMVIKQENKVTYVPFHAVISIEETSTVVEPTPVEDEACKEVE